MKIFVRWNLIWTKSKEIGTVTPMSENKMRVVLASFDNTHKLISLHFITPTKNIKRVGANLDEIILDDHVLPESLVPRNTKTADYRSSLFFQIYC